jgi:hypothetical protein
MLGVTKQVIAFLENFLGRKYIQLIQEYVTYRYLLERESFYDRTDQLLWN